MRDERIRSKTRFNMLGIIILAVLLLASVCEDPPPPEGTGAFILGARTVLPPTDERILSGGTGETLSGLEGLQATVSSVRVVHRTDRDDPSTDRVLEVDTEGGTFELVGSLEDGAPRTLGFFNIPVGYVFQLRLVVESLTITIDGETYDVRTPSGSTSGLKIDPDDGEPFIIEEGKRTGGRVLINPFDQLLRNRGVGFQLKPHFLAEHVTALDLLGFIEDQVVVGYALDVSREEIYALNAEVGASIMWCWWPTNYCTLKLPIDMPVQQALEHYATHDRVRFVLPNNVARQTADPPPDDPEYLNDNQQQLQQVWVYRDAPEETGAWDVNTGINEIVVAIIDMGFTMDHPDIIENIWINTNEIPDRVLAAVGDLNGNEEADPLDLDVTGGPGGTPDGVVTFADLDELAIGMGYGDEVCAISNTPPDDRCNPSDLVNGDAPDPEPPEYYGWEDGEDGDALGDGYIDDIVGWAFAEEESQNHNLPVQISPNNHGETVAGIIAAIGQNGLDMAGVSWSARLMSVRPVPLDPGVLAPDEAWPTMRSAIITALLYAVEHGADIAVIELGFYASINYEVTNWCIQNEISAVSDYGDKWEEYEEGLLQELTDEVDLSHTLVAIPAGNCPINIGSNGVLRWPGDLAGPNRSWIPSFIRVGGVDSEDNLWFDFQNEGFSSGSVFGIESVDIAAPSTDFVGLQHDAFWGGTDSGHTGTSFAAPLVAGVGALILSHDEDLRASRDAHELAERILRNADEHVGDLDGQVNEGRRLNAVRAVLNERTE